VRTRKTVAEADKLARIIKLLLFIMEHSGVPEYSCEKSNHVYSFRQKIALLVLRQEERESYDRFCRKMGSYSTVMELLGLKIVPHPTTLSKFAKTLDPGHLERVVACFAVAVKDEGLVLAVDGTAFSNTAASKHYVKRLAHFRGRKVAYGKKAARGFVKASFIGDTDTKVILSLDVVMDHTHDSVMGKRALKILEEHGIKAAFLDADKGHGWEESRRLAGERVGAVALIPPRETPEGRKGSGRRRTKGVNRCKMKWMLAVPKFAFIYAMRAIIESINSVVKRLFGDAALCRLLATVRTEIACRVVAHNLERVDKLGLGRLFGA
jgi:hypothetical protein